jgi:hypothetical protein
MQLEADLKYIDIKDPGKEASQENTIKSEVTE